MTPSQTPALYGVRVGDRLVLTWHGAGGERTLVSVISVSRTQVTTTHHSLRHVWRTCDGRMVGWTRISPTIRRPRDGEIEELTGAAEKQSKQSIGGTP